MDQDQRETTNVVAPAAPLRKRHIPPELKLLGSLAKLTMMDGIPHNGSLISSAP